MLEQTNARDKELELALEQAIACMERYNIAHSSTGGSPTRGMIGSSCEKLPSEILKCTGIDEKIAISLKAYHEWTAAYLTSLHAVKTDNAMKNLRHVLADENAVSKILGLSNSGEDVQIKDALTAAGFAIAAECKQQEEDALSLFPCTALVRAGRMLLELCHAESAAKRQVSHLCQSLEAAIERSKQCEHSQGKLAKEKNRIVEQLKNAREKHNVAAGMEQMAVLLQVNDALISAMRLTVAPDLEESRQKVREAAAMLTATTVQLTGEMQQFFPEVILFIGKGLPPELGALWRPAQVLDSFDHKELLQTHSRHPVWKVREGNRWYAVKEYRISAPSDLNICLKEAAIIYRQRHRSIIEIKAIFQDIRNNGNAFYIQMPWCEHGTLEQWTTSAQRPEWFKVSIPSPRFQAQIFPRTFKGNSAGMTQ